MAISFFSFHATAIFDEANWICAVHTYCMTKRTVSLSCYCCVAVFKWSSVSHLRPKRLHQSFSLLLEHIAFLMATIGRMQRINQIRISQRTQIEIESLPHWIHIEKAMQHDLSLAQWVWNMLWNKFWQWSEICYIGINRTFYKHTHTQTHRLSHYNICNRPKRKRTNVFLCGK